MFTGFEDDDEGPKTELVPAINLPSMPEQPTTVETDRILVILAELDRDALDNDVITRAARDILTHTISNQALGNRFKTPTQTKYEIVHTHANQATVLMY